MYGWSGVARNLLPLIALYMLAPLFASRSLIYAWSLAPAIGLLLYRLTIVMHDCGHASLFVSRNVNQRVGTLLGALTGVDFEQFKQRHWEHHRNYGRPGDPQGFHYLDIALMSRSAFIWHLLKPMLGLNLRFVFPESHLFPKNVRRNLGNGNLILFIAVQAIVLLLVTGFGAHSSLVLLPFLSATTFGLFFSQLRGIAEHGVRGTADPAGFVRSHSPDLLGRLFLYDLNFNFHEEHHQYPQVPSCHLAAVNASHRGRGEGSMWGTLATLTKKNEQDQGLLQ